MAYSNFTLEEVLSTLEEVLSTFQLEKNVTKFWVSLRTWSLKKPKTFER